MTDEIIKYNIADESFEIRPDYEQDTVWMTKAEMAHLFGIDRSGVSRHISKAFKNNELNKKKQCAKNAHSKFGRNGNNKTNGCQHFEQE